MMNNINAKIGFIPNMHLLLFGGIFFLITQCYLFLYNNEPQNFSSDILNLFLLVLFFLFLLKTENKIKDVLPFWIFIFTLFVNLCLIYSIYSNPQYVLGARATVQFGTEQFTGNPYIYARNGFAGFIISYLIIKYRSNPNIFISNFFTQFFCYFNLWLSSLVILLTQTRSIFLSFILILFPLFFLTKKNNLYPFKTDYNYPLFTFYSLFGVLLIYFNNQYNIFNFISGSFTHSYEIFLNALDTGINMGSNIQDDSAMTRVGGIKIMVNKIIERPEFLFFGAGYRFLYMDIPFLEVFINFGIFSFILYFIFQGYIFKSAITSIFSKDIFQIFLGFMSFQVLIAIFTTGRCMDFSYWVTYLVLMRFYDNDINIYDRKLT